MTFTPDDESRRARSSVRQYFDATAKSFDAIYSSPRRLDRVFRRDMYDRFHKTLEACSPVDGKSVLDIGCGSGQYTVAFAERGAGEAVGLDFAPNMLAIAGDNARQAGVGDRCGFVCAEFLTHRFDRCFDYVVAVGVFDYVRAPLPFLEKARELTRERFVATFPRLLTWRALPRAVRLKFAGCPVFFYTRRRVVDLMTQAGFVADKVEVCGNLYWASGKPR